MSLWFVGYFKLKTIKTWPRSESNFDLFPDCLKNIQRFVPGSGVSRVYSVFHCLCMTQQIFICQTFAFPSASLSFKVLSHYPQHPILSIAKDGFSGEGFCSFAVTQISWVTPRCTYYYLFFSFCLNVNFSDQPEEPMRVEENFFLTNAFQYDKISNLIFLLDLLI